MSHAAGAPGTGRGAKARIIAVLPHHDPEGAPLAAATTPDTDEAAKLEQLARDLDRARLKQIGGFHFALVIGALTLWGAAET